MKRLLLIACTIGLVWVVFGYEPRARWKGFPAPQDPAQSSQNLPAPFQSGRFTVTPLATYDVTAVVLSRDHYRFDEGAEISPLDLALGWGPMSVASVINDLSVSQSGRWYNYHWWNTPPLDPQLIITHSANTHCIPADRNVRRALLAVHRHDLITLHGYLVEVRRPDGWHWRSSLTREDSGGGACELMWVTGVETRSLER